MGARKNQFTAYLREMVGTFILVLLGIGVVANVKLAPQLSAQAYNWNTIVTGCGLAYALAIFISGAHLNLAVTLAFAVRRNLPWHTVFFYILAQFCGGFLSAAGLWFMYQDGLAPAGFPNVWVTDVGAVF